MNRTPRSRSVKPRASGAQANITRNDPEGLKSPLNIRDEISHEATNEELEACQLLCEALHEFWQEPLGAKISRKARSQEFNSTMEAISRSFNFNYEWQSNGFYGKLPTEWIIALLCHINSRQMFRTQAVKETLKLPEGLNSGGDNGPFEKAIQEFMVLRDQVQNAESLYEKLEITTRALNQDIREFHNELTANNDLLTPRIQQQMFAEWKEDFNKKAITRNAQATLLRKQLMKTYEDLPGDLVVDHRLGPITEKARNYEHLLDLLFLLPQAEQFEEVQQHQTNLKQTGVKTKTTHGTHLGAINKENSTPGNSKNINPIMEDFFAEKDFIDNLEYEDHSELGPDRKKEVQRLIMKIKGKSNLTPKEARVSKKLTMITNQVKGLNEKMETMEDPAEEHLDLLLKRLEASQRGLQELDFEASEAFDEEIIDLTNLVLEMQDTVTTHKVDAKTKKQEREDEKRNESKRTEKLFESYEIPNLHTHLDLKKWDLAVSHNLPKILPNGQYKSPRVAIALAEKLKTTVKIPELSAAIKYVKDPARIKGIIVGSTSTTALNRDSLKVLESATIGFPYRKGREYDWPRVLSAISEAQAIIRAFEGNLQNISDQLFNMLKRRVLVGQFARRLHEMLQGASSHGSVEAVSVNMDPETIDKLYEDLEKPEVMNVSLEQKLTNSMASRATAVKIVSIVFDKSAKAIASEVNEAVYQKDTFTRESYKGEVVHNVIDISDEEEEDFETVLHIVEDTEPRDKESMEKKKLSEMIAARLVEAAKSHFFNKRKGQDDVQSKWESRFGPCPLKCGKKHFLKSLRFCSLALRKNPKELANLEKSLAQNLCFKCKAPNHQASACRMRKLKCLGCQSSAHSVAFCTHLTLQERFETIQKRWGNLDQVFTVQDAEESSCDEGDFEDHDQVNFITENTKQQMVFGNADTSYFSLDKPRVSHLEDVDQIHLIMDNEDDTDSEEEYYHDCCDEQIHMITDVSDEDKTEVRETPAGPVDYENLGFTNNDYETMSAPTPSISHFPSSRPITTWSLLPMQELELSTPSPPPISVTPLSSRPTSKSLVRAATIFLSIICGLSLMSYTFAFMTKNKHLTNTVNNQTNSGYLTSTANYEFLSLCCKSYYVKVRTPQMPNSKANVAFESPNKAKGSKLQLPLGWTKNSKLHNLTKQELQGSSSMKTLVCATFLIMAWLTWRGRIHHLIIIITGVILLKSLFPLNTNSEKDRMCHDQVMFAADPSGRENIRMRKIQPIQSLWVTSELFTVREEARQMFETKSIKGRECVKLNVLFDSGSTLNLISKSVAKTLNAKVGHDPSRAFVGAQPGTLHGISKFTNALFYNENMREFIKTASLHVTEKDLHPLITEPGAVRNFVKTYLTP